MQNSNVAKHFYGDVDIHLGQLKNAKLEGLSSLPTADASNEKRIVYLTTDKRFYACVKNDSQDSYEWVKIVFPADITAALSDYVPKTRKVNNKALTGDISLDKSDVGLGNVDNTSDANKPVSAAQADAIALAKTQAITAGAVTLEKSADGLTYTLKQGGVALGVRIDIPKDMVVKKGSIVKGTWNNDTFTPSASGTGKALKLELQNSNDIIYINVADLVDAYTGDGVTIEISNNNIVSIKNGAITKEKLAREVKDELMSSTEKTKLSGIAAGAQVNVIETVKVNGTALTPSGKAVDVTVPTKTSDLNNDSNFVNQSTMNSALAEKVDKVTGKGLSTNDYTTAEKEKLRDIEAGATRNVVFVSGVLTGSSGSIGKSTHGCSEIGSVQAYVGGELVEVGIEIVEESVGSITTNSKINWYSNTAFTSSNNFRLRIVGK